MEAYRLFVAISLPEPVKNEIEKTQAELRAAMPGHFIRWTKRDQFHLTMRFLGDVDAVRVGALVSAMRDACANFPALRLCAEGLGFFPNPKFPRVMWIGIRDEAERLQKLHLLVDAAVGGFTREKAEAHFVGHVTLARIPNIRRPQAELLSKVAAGVAGKFFGEWTANKIAIIRSELSPSGARYTTLAEIAFGSEK